MPPAAPRTVTLESCSSQNQSAHAIHHPALVLGGGMCSGIGDGAYLAGRNREGAGLDSGGKHFDGDDDGLRAAATRIWKGR